ncbi:transposable element Tc1 transposase [Trichonephila clavipes]|nr:transposable element Tc1 transposase [Trichonephila clavipes]
MDWPAYSPDLNPIEHVCDALGRRIAVHHPENTRQLKQMLIEEWALLPQEMLHQLVLRMRRQCEATIAMRGGTAMAGSDVVQSRRPIFDDFFQHLWPYIGNNTVNVVFQMVKRLWLIRIDQ